MSNTSDTCKIGVVRAILNGQEPALPYEYALWCEDVARNLKELATDYENKAKREIERIVRDKIESNVYEVVYPVEQKQAIDYEKLKIEQPEVYNKIVHLKPSDAVSLIGESKAYKIAAQSKNYNPKMDVITLLDLKRALKKKAPDYIRFIYKPQSSKIVPIGSYLDPRELPEAGL